MSTTKRFYWLMVGPTDEVEPFVREYKLPDNQILRAPSVTARRALRKLGITATPTRIVLNPHGLVREVKIMNKELATKPDSLELDVCRKG